MNMNKPKNLLILLLTMLFSLQSNAVGIKEATWYLTVDVNQVVNNELFKHLHSHPNEMSLNIEKIPKEIDTITMYGDSRGSDDATAVLKGDFSQFSVYDFALNFIYHKKDNAAKLATESTIRYASQDILVLEVKDENKSDDDRRNKEIYFSAINDEISVVSLNLNEVKNWIDNVYSPIDINNGSIFSVLVNVRSALAHMGMNLEKNSHMMHSEIFKKVTEVSASVTEANDDIVIEVALTAADSATATQIEQVISGLIAMNNLSGANDDNQLHAIFMQNLTITKDDNAIMISTFAPIDELKNIDVHKHMKHDNTVKVEVNVGL